VQSNWLFSYRSEMGIRIHQLQRIPAKGILSSTLHCKAKWLLEGLAGFASKSSRGKVRRVSVGGILARSFKAGIKIDVGAASRRDARTGFHSSLRDVKRMTRNCTRP
jgi:hypothetical protein